MSLPEVYLASVLLEPNRWKPGRPPSIRVSEWTNHAAAAGFEGWELWENHYLLATKEERLALRQGSLPVAIFNSYAPFDVNGSNTRAESLAAAGELPRVSAMKFNVGHDPAAVADYHASIESARVHLAPKIRLLCECHPNTLLETPEALSAFTAGMETWPFDVIIHPFLSGPENIRSWFSAAGQHISHVHVQMRDRQNPHVFVGLADDKPRARDCLAALAGCGFRGTFTLEFSAPTGTTEESPENLFCAARRDLDFILEFWPASNCPGAKS